MMNIFDKMIEWMAGANVASVAYRPYTGTLPKGVVRKGTKGADAKSVQRFLNWCIKAGLAVDGMVGTKTVKAIKKFQKQFGLKVDGVFGTKSVEKARALVKQYSKPSTNTTASAKTVQDNMCSWAKKIADSGKYKYKKWTSDPKTHQCPICHDLTGKYKGWNCIGFAFASWRHGGGLKSKCDCGVIANDTWEKLLKAKTDADAAKIAKKYIGVDVKVIRNNKKAIPTDKLKKGDIVGYFKGSNYFHTVLYVSSGKIAESNTTTPNISYGKKLSSGYGKVAIRYTGK